MSEEPREHPNLNVLLRDILSDLSNLVMVNLLNIQNRQTKTVHTETFLFLKAKGPLKLKP